MENDFFSPLKSDERASASPRTPEIWSVGGGKGGIGKSFISSSLAISLARSNRKVLAIDLDLGGANLHTTLGLELPRQTLNDFFSGRVAQIEACITPSSVPNLDLISGAQDSVGVVNLSYEQRLRFIEASKKTNYDIILYDLGAGTATHTLDFYLAAHVPIVALLPEPTSIENAYRFLKAAYFRKLWLSPRLKEIRKWIELSMDAKNTEGIRSPSDLFKVVQREAPQVAADLRAEIESFRPRLIVNQVRTQSDIEIGFSVKTVCRKYFGIDVDFLGTLDYDNSVWQAIRKKRPAMLEFPHSKLSQAVDRLVDYLTRKRL